MTRLADPQRSAKTLRESDGSKYREFPIKTQRHNARGRDWAEAGGQEAVTLDVDLRISTHPDTITAARWNIKGKTGTITLFLPKVAEIAEEELREIPARNLPAWTADAREALIADILVFSYLEERICIERANQRIRLMRDKCKPCAVLPVATAMWKAITA
jgi:hypothetical protein